MTDEADSLDAVIAAMKAIKARLAADPAGKERAALEDAYAQLSTILEDLAIRHYDDAAASVDAAAKDLQALVDAGGAAGSADALRSVINIMGGKSPGGGKTPSPPPPSPPPPSPPPAPAPQPSPGAGNAMPFASAAVSTAIDEWNYFGDQEYDMNGKLVKGGHKEGEGIFAQRVGTYWSEGTGTHGIDGNNHDMPWSAAFISWVMKRAGAGDRFRYSTQHSVYIYQGIRDFLNKRDAAGFWTWRLNECKPKIGDIVCWSRQPGIDYDHQNLGVYKGHSDIVVAVEPDRIWVIGGNVGDSVTKRPLPCGADGYLVESVRGAEKLFALMQDRIQAGAGPLQAPGSPTLAGAIAWGKKVDAAFKQKLVSISSRLACDPSHLMAAMAFETGESFAPDEENPKSHAIGLIQFMKKTAEGLGTSIDDLRQMTAVEQLDYVQKYMDPYKGRLKTLSDVYMAILWPAAVGKPDATVLFERPSETYDQNRGLDVNKDGKITKGEAASKVQRELDEGLSAQWLG